MKIKYSKEVQAVLDNKEKTDKEKTHLFAKALKEKRSYIFWLEEVLLYGTNNGKPMKPTYKENIDNLKKILISFIKKNIEINSAAHSILNPYVKQDSLEKQYQDYLKSKPNIQKIIKKNFYAKGALINECKRNIRKV